MASKAQDTGTGRGGGLLDSVKVLLGTLLTIAHTRLELLSTEIEGMEASDEMSCGKKKDLANIKTPQGAIL